MTPTMSVFSTKMSFPGAGMLFSTPGRCYSELSDPTSFLQSLQSHCLWDAGVRSLQKEACPCCSLGLAAKSKSTVFISGVSRCLVPCACPAMSHDPHPSHHAIRTGGGFGAKSFSQMCAMIPAARASPRTLVIVRSRSLQRHSTRMQGWPQPTCLGCWWLWHMPAPP